MRNPGRSVVVSGAGTGGRGLLNLQQELQIRLCFAQFRQEELDRLLLIERMKHPAQFPDDLQLIWRKEQVFRARARRVII